MTSFSLNFDMSSLFSFLLGKKRKERNEDNLDDGDHQYHAERKRIMSKERLQAFRERQSALKVARGKLFDEGEPSSEKVCQHRSVTFYLFYFIDLLFCFFFFIHYTGSRPLAQVHL